jgi:hypothetical protein
LPPEAWTCFEPLTERRQAAVSGSQEKHSGRNGRGDIGHRLFGSIRHVWFDDLAGGRLARTKKPLQDHDG